MEVRKKNPQDTLRRGASILHMCKIWKYEIVSICFYKENYNFILKAPILMLNFISCKLCETEQVNEHFSGKKIARQIQVKHVK